MADNEIKQVMINGRLIGISGLTEAIMEVAGFSNSLSDNEIQKRLLELLAVHNYIPASAEEAYGKAVLREFKIAQGEQVDAETFSGFRIAVLGAGCMRCTQLETDVRDILSELKIAADLQHIIDLKEISRYGLMGLPALVIGNKVVAAGEVPPKNKIRKWIIENFDLQNKK
ncbi:MAG: thioredoxin family protein [Smithella sp.]